MSEKLVVDINFLNTKNFEIVSEKVGFLLELLRYDFNARNDEVVISLNNEERLTRINDLLFGLILVPAVFPIKDTLSVYDIPIYPEVQDKEKVIENFFTEAIRASIPLNKREEVQTNIADCITLMAKTTWDINVVYGNTINLKDIIDLCKKDPKFRELVNFKFDETTQYADIMDSIHEANDTMINYLRNTDTCYGTLVDTISANQFQEVMVSVGLKPDSKGKIIPKPINTSLYRGLKDPHDYYIMSLGARKALIINDMYVANAGYLGRKLILLMFKTLLEKDVEDCGTTEYLEYTPTEKNHGRFINKFVRIKGSEDVKFYPVTEEDVKAKRYVGIPLEVRSPITCKLHGDKKCKTCYGKHADYNQFHIGIKTAVLLSKQFQQLLLSSKHLNHVNVDTVVLPETVDEYLRIELNDLIAKKDITFKVQEYREVNKGVFEITSLVVDGQEEPINFGNLNLFCNNLEDYLENDGETLHMKEGDMLFRVEIDNNETSKYLKNLIRLIEYKSELAEYTSVEALTQHMLDLIIDSKVRCDLNSVELIVSKMMRDTLDLTIKPKSHKENFVFLGIKEAIVNSDSISESLAFEKMRDIFENKILLKHGTSPMDILFQV